MKDRCALTIKEWHGPSAVECYEKISEKNYALFFDSNRPKHPLNRWSFICWAPIETIEIKNGSITHNDAAVEAQDIFDFLKTRLDLYNFTTKTDIPFIGGAAGYFGYDLGRQLEDIPALLPDDIDVPDACIGIYTNVIAFDHTHNKAWKIGDADLPDMRQQPHTYNPVALHWRSDKTEEAHCEDIQKVIDHIYAGEIYQANLTRRFMAELQPNFNKFAHYKYLRSINPAPFAGFMNFGKLQLASCSPEQFLGVRGKDVKTRPIKGTLPSTFPAAELENSIKDRAENTMIVDLLRNDLSRVCDFHSVSVPILCNVETFEGLHHLVSTVRGVLQKNKNSLDALKACFPGGSITGAPKIRAMQIIEELEKTRRGPYCGAMGYIDFNGNMDTNIIIRTLIYANNKAYLQTGGGIVSDSNPQKELQESLDKAAKIFESFKVISQEDTV